MNLTRRGFVGSIVGAAGVAALAPVARALPEARDWHDLGPVKYEFFTLIASVTVEQMAGGLKVDDWHKHAVWTLKPFPPGIELTELIPVLVEEEFTEAERPGTGGGVIGNVPDVHEAWPLEDGSGSWVVQIGLAEFGNQCPWPEKELWIQARGKIWV